MTTASTDSSNPAIADAPAALTVINLQQLQGRLTDVGPVAFQSSNELMVVSSNLPGYRSIKELKIDGSDLAQATTNSQYGDVTSMAVSTVDSTAEAAAPDDPTVHHVAAAAVYVTLGQPGALGPILKLQGSLATGNGSRPTHQSDGHQPVLPELTYWRCRTRPWADRSCPPTVRRSTKTADLLRGSRSGREAGSMSETWNPLRVALDLVLPRPCPGCGGPEPWSS